MRPATVPLASRVAFLTVGVFGAANSTCGDWWQLYCDRNAAVGKMSPGPGERGTPWNMKRSAANHHKSHNSLRRPGGRRPGAVAPAPGFLCGAVVGWAGAPGVAALAPPGAGGLAELVFAAVRPAFVAACMVSAAGNQGGLRERAGRRERPRARCRAAGREDSWNAFAANTGAGAGGLSRTGSGALPHRGKEPWQGKPCQGNRVNRNRQMEHMVQVAASLRGGVRRGSAIAPREQADGVSLVLTTLGN